MQNVRKLYSVTDSRNELNKITGNQFCFSFVIAIELKMMNAVDAEYWRRARVKDGSEKPAMRTGKLCRHAARPCSGQPDLSCMRSM